MVAPRTSSTRSRWVLAILLVVLAALLPPSAASAGDRDGGPTLTVMTRNLYLGTGLNNTVTATTPEQLVEAVTDDWAHVVATDFPTRAGALAAEVGQTRPDVIGLQEVTLWRDQLVSDAATAPGPNASDVVHDFLAILLARLASHGIPYVAVSTSVNADVEAPRQNPLSPTGLTDIRVTDRDVILVRSPLLERFGNPRDGHYSAQLVLPSRAGPISFTRGWASIDYRLDARTRVRIFDTHLEVGSPVRAAQVQVAQGNEFLALTAASPYPVIALGDFNSAADGSATTTYADLTGSLTDAWRTARPRDHGFTFGQSELLDTVKPAVRRIDLVLSARPWSADRATLVGNVPFRSAPSPLWASDHFGVVVRLELHR
jgi:endonuclease/exonuclease/phosphatase family metal-dependent hydrolase